MKERDQSIEKGRKVRVKDAFKEDAGRGRIRIDPDVIRELELRNGDVIQIFHPLSKNYTAALLYPGKFEDSGSNTIRIDQSLMRNLGASLDDIVEIWKIEAKKAEKITLAGLIETAIVRNTQQLAQKLENRVITIDDILSFYAMGRRVDLIVVDFTPKTDVVRILADSKIYLSERSYNELKEIEKKKITFDDIKGLKKQKQVLLEQINIPIMHPEIIKKIGITPNKGFIFFGPSGTGKTLLARSLEFETEASFITIDGAQVMSKFYGESEGNLRKKFEEAEQRAPSIIFINNLDLIAANRNTLQGDIERRMVGQLLSLIDNIEKKEYITIIGETDRIHVIDPAFRRSGRFEQEIEFQLPNREERYEILLFLTKKISLGSDVDLNIIAEKTREYSGADLKGLINEASSLAIREILPLVDLNKIIPKDILDKLEIKMDHLLAALTTKKILLYCTKCNLTYCKTEYMIYCSKCGEKLKDHPL